MTYYIKYHDPKIHSFTMFHTRKSGFLIPKPDPNFVPSTKTNQLKHMDDCEITSQLSRDYYETLCQFHGINRGIFTAPSIPLQVTWTGHRCDDRCAQSSRSWGHLRFDFRPWKPVPCLLHHPGWYNDHYVNLNYDRKQSKIQSKNKSPFLTTIHHHEPILTSQHPFFFNDTVHYDHFWPIKKNHHDWSPVHH